MLNLSRKEEEVGKLERPRGGHHESGIPYEVSCSEGSARGVCTWKRKKGKKEGRKKEKEIELLDAYIASRGTGTVRRKDTMAYHTQGDTSTLYVN